MGAGVAATPALIPPAPETRPAVTARTRRRTADATEPSDEGATADSAVRRRIRSSQGIQRARSATEAFVYHRLETLPQTRGRFGLNVELPIPFDGRGHMEVDLLCVEARIAVELDGPQHLSDPEAYRRDRRKDALLQEHGYHVLRFLAVDVGTHLDDLLDTILRALAHRQVHPPTPPA